MAEVTQQLLSITPSAIAELKAIRDQEGGGKVLRVGVKGGGCAGLTYVLDFDEKGSLDQEYDFDGLRVVMDPCHALYVSGMEVDYNDGLNDRGFVFRNPNAKSSCGCGTSFST
ncbi:MAG: iron-sulfur cluster assembly accessory protein [Bacteroidia bacterium]